MSEPGDRRVPSATPRAPATAGKGGLWEHFRPTSMGVALAEALGVALLVALAWALLAGILELSVGLLAVAALGGWSIGAVLRQVRPAPLLAAVIGALAWLSALVLTWVVTRVVLQSDDSLLERFDSISFLSFTQQLFGIVEIAGLVLFVAGAAYSARPRR